MFGSFRRYADRTGKVVHWGNMIAGMLGQEFRETFATEEEARERERQALALESIGEDRPPKAVKRTVVR